MTSQLRGKLGGNQVFSFYKASIVETGRGEEGGKWSLDRPEKVLCLPLPGHFMTITTFSLPILPLIRFNNNFLGEDLINKSMSKRSPEKIFFKF